VSRQLDGRHLAGSGVHTRARSSVIELTVIAIAANTVPYHRRFLM